MLNSEREYDTDPRSAVARLIPPWSVDSHLAFMNSTNISRSVLLLGPPGTNILYGNVSLAVSVAYQANT